MSELSRRVLFGLPAAAVFLYLIWLDGIVFQVFAGLIALAVLIEMVRLFGRMGSAAVVSFSIVTGIFFWFARHLPFWILFSFSTVIVLTAVWSLITRNNESSQRWLSTIFCGLYAPIGLFFFYQVRLLEPDDSGLWFTYALILMIWGNDIFAYFGGRTFGKRSLAPRVSPNKTWEGFWSGFAGALIGFIIIFFIANPFPVYFYKALPMVFIVSIFGPVGDLAESRLKRLAGVKDSSNLLPGHGGVFDRFDALILCSPVIYFYLNWII